MEPLATPWLPTGAPGMPSRRILASPRIRALRCGPRLGWPRHRPPAENGSAPKTCWPALSRPRASEPVEYASAGANLAELYWSLAVACARLGDVRETLNALRQAIRTGWRDADWLARDP